MKLEEARAVAMTGRRVESAGGREAYVQEHDLTGTLLWKDTGNPVTAARSTMDGWRLIEPDDLEAAKQDKALRDFNKQIAELRDGAVKLFRGLEEAARRLRRLSQSRRER